MYFPRSDRGFLQSYPYFPSDFETADLSSIPWWQNILNRLSEFVETLGACAVASPVYHPRLWNTEYYDLCASVSDSLVKELNKSSIRIFTTVMTRSHLKIILKE